MSRRLRLTVFAIIALLALLAIGVVITASVLLKPARFTAMLEQVAASAGFELRMDGPAAMQLWPHLGVRMHGLRLSAAGSDKPLLVAGEAHLVVPWSSLLGDEIAISQLQLQAPRVDVAQIPALLRALPGSDETAAVRLPTIDAGVRIHNGQVVRGNELLLRNVDLTTGSLVPGKPFNLDATALARAGKPVSLHLRVMPRQQADALRFDPLHVHLASDAVDVQLVGQFVWRGASNISGLLDGSLTQGGTTWQLSVELQPPSDADGARVHVAVDDSGGQLDMRLQLAQTMQWWRDVADGGTPRLPPVQASIDVARLDVGGIHVEGLQIDSDVPSVAASAASASAASVAPAAAASR